MKIVSPLKQPVLYFHSAFFLLTVLYYKWLSELSTKLSEKLGVGKFLSIASPRNNLPFHPGVPAALNLLNNLLGNGI